MIKSNIPPRFCKKEPEREFRNSGTRGRPLTQRDLPTTLQEADDSSCVAKVQNILVGCARDFFISLRSFFISHRKFASGTRSGGYRIHFLEHGTWSLEQTFK